MTRVIVFLTSVFAVLPGAIVVMASLTAGTTLAFPPQGLSLRWYHELLGSGEFLDALATSVILACVSSVLAVALALPAAFALIRYRPTGGTTFEAVLLSPLAVPHVVIGIGILQVYSLLGLRTDLVTLTLGHLVITVPFALRMLMASLSGLDPRTEQVAASLGAPPHRVLTTIILPQLKLGMIAALVATFIISFDDLALTVFLVQPGYATVPILLFSQAENNPGPIIHAASVVLLVASWIGLFLMDRLVGLERMMLSGSARES